MGMKIEEARKLIAVFMATYSNYNPVDVELAAQIWARATEEYTCEQVNKAFQVYMRTNTSGFAPNPGQIIDEMYNLSISPLPNENEAWSLVLDSISASKRDFTPTVHFDRLPELIRKSIGGGEMFCSLIYSDEKELRAAKHDFVRCYNNEREKKRKKDKLPRALKEVPTHELISAANETSNNNILEADEPRGVQA